MELEERIFQEKSYFFYNKESIYIIHYSKGENVAVSYGLINNINEVKISHFCCTDKGASGSPIINISNNKIIGIHTQSSKSYEQNYGKFLKEPINDFISKNNLFKDNIKKYLFKDKISNYFEESNIIRKEDEINFIISALRKKINFRDIKNIYWATIQDDSIKDFKRCCNNKGPTLIIIKSEKDEIFGGFTKSSWNNNNHEYGYDKDSFLYSITNKKVFDIINPEKAIINFDIGYLFACFGNTNNWNGIYLGDKFLSDSNAIAILKN